MAPAANGLRGGARASNVHHAMITVVITGQQRARSSRGRGRRRRCGDEHVCYLGVPKRALSYCEVMCPWHWPIA